ncbi:MAG: trypsin-like peptidase domain-containing protein, partial [Myxococcaceae bacterium]
MIRFTWASAVVALASTLSCATTPAPTAPALVRLPGLERLTRREWVRQLLPHAVRVYVYEGEVAKRSASGVVVATETGVEGVLSYVVTNAHAVDASGLKDPVWKIVVENRADQSEFRAEVLAVGKVPEMDLALLRVPGAALAPAELANDDELELGDDVIVIGAPYGKGLSLSGGMVSLVEWDSESRAPKMLKTDA